MAVHVGEPVNMKFWTWPSRRAMRKKTEIITIGTAIANQAALAFKNHPVTIHHDVKQYPRPPAPRPIRITIVYTMQDGQEIRTFIPLHGQAFSTEPWPHWLNPNASNWPPVHIRYELGYQDGGVL